MKSAALLLLFLSVVISPLQAEEFRFRVYLGESEIGWHTFTLIKNNKQIRISSNAVFSAKLLGVIPYNYSHKSEEVWSGGCLIEINSRTRDNGTNYTVIGNADENGFSLNTSESNQALSGCVRTYAYWNKAYLQSARALLNPQDGIYKNTIVEFAGKENIFISGKIKESDKYILINGESEIVLWYGADSGEWLGLESKTRTGKNLLYKRTGL